MNDLMTTDRRERPAEAVAVAETPAGVTMRGAAGGPGRVGRVLSLVRLHLLGLRGPLPSLLGLLLIVGAAGIVFGSAAPVSGFLAGTALVGGLSGVMAERSGINRLLASLPVSRADVVNSYWALAVLHLLAASVLYAFIGLPLGVRPGKLLVLPLVLIVGQALGIPVFLHFGPGRGLLVWVVSILAIGALGLLVSSVGPIRDLAPGATTGGGLLLALGAGALIGLWVLSHRLYLKQDQ
ncbi:ABC-2 transporter permease [Actinomyces oris]|uniref:ABC-2 transporter permease n=1 Tax=Actinomyces oris TaxID=544580 RepID=UPI00288AB5C7|nr:ABC-2 transporter permease [Actinomyces oris]